MAQTNILLEAGTNELEVVEFYLEEFTPPSADAPQLDENGEPVPAKPYRGYYGVNVAKVLEIIRMPKVTALPEVQHPSVLVLSTCARALFRWWIWPCGWAKPTQQKKNSPKPL